MVANPWSEKPKTDQPEEKTVIEFVIPCVPVAQPRQRHAVINGHVRNFTPTKHPVNAFKAACQLAADQVYRGAPWSGPVHLEAVFVFPRPKSKVWKTKPMPRELHTSKPDLDNVQKSLNDALTGRIYADDSQICVVEAAKLVASGDEQPHVEVKFTRLAV